MKYGTVRLHYAWLTKNYLSPSYSYIYIYAYSAIHSLQMCKAIEKEIQNQSSIMSSIINLPITFLMLMAAAMAQSQGFSMSMIPIVSPRFPFFPRNLTLVEIHQNVVKLSKAHALRFMTVSPNTNPSSTIRSLVKRAFSGYLYVEIYTCSPPVKTNLALDTGSS